MAAILFKSNSFFGNYELVLRCVESSLNFKLNLTTSPSVGDIDSVNIVRNLKHYHKNMDQIFLYPKCHAKH